MRWLGHETVTTTEADVETLTATPYPGRIIELVLPCDGVPPTLPRFVRTIRELQTARLGTKNVSPRIAFELHRPSPGDLRLQYCVPTRRLERKVRLQLADAIPNIRYREGTATLPVGPEDTIGGGFLVPGRDDWYPFRTEYADSPMNAVVAALHRHAMQDTRFVIQCVFQPVTGQPLRQWWWTRRAYKQLSYLRKEKEGLWGGRSATPREKRQATRIEAKAGNPLLWCSLRVLVIGAGEYTGSRLREIAGAFNVFEDPETSQYLGAESVTPLRRTDMLRFYRAAKAREYRSWSRKFRVSTDELAGLVSLPSTRMQNLEQAAP